MNTQQQQFLRAIPISWQSELEETIRQSTTNTLITFLKKREHAGARIYPQKNAIFAALQFVSPDDVTVIIIGQDPYHGFGQAHGLAFSVPKGITPPPSLRNIYKELSSDLAISFPTHGDLTHWTTQGVLLLNAILTVEEGSPAHHANRGWEEITDAIVVTVLKRNKPTVLLLWGAYAQKKIQKVSQYVNDKHHLIIKSAHPSPLSASKFFGSKPFSQTNQWLTKHGLNPIAWQL